MRFSWQSSLGNKKAVIENIQLTHGGHLGAVLEEVRDYNLKKCTFVIQNP